MIFQAGIGNPLDFIRQLLERVLLKVVIGVLIFLIGFVVGKLLGRIVYQGLKEIELNNFLRKSTGMKVNAEQIISNTLTYFIYFLSLVAALDQIGVTSVILYLISAAIILIVLISFFLSIRDLVPNMISGLYIYSRFHSKEGSQIEVNDISGELLQVDLLHIKVKTKKGDILYIPNSLVASSPIKIKKD